MVKKFIKNYLSNIIIFLSESYKSLLIFLENEFSEQIQAENQKKMESLEVQHKEQQYIHNLTKIK